jgi:glucosyl-dolichyl phosphate glucuronosyltransferase
VPDAPGEQPDISVVVCTYTFDRWAVLAETIESVARGSVKPREVVIVVDGNPSLLTALVAVSWPMPVRIIPSSGRGVADARNAGWEATSGQLVAFIDDDGVASPTWLQELAEAIDVHQAGIVGGRVEPRWSNGEPAWYSPSLGWIVGCSYEGLPTTASPVRNVIGCNMLIRRELLQRLDGFESSLGRTQTSLAGGEETDICIRANAAGAGVVMIPGAKVAQVLPHERATLAYAIRRGWDEGDSKQQLVGLRGPVLGTESRYARSLLREAVRRFGRGARRASARELQRAAGLLIVLSATTLSYIAHTLAAKTRALIHMSGRPVDGPIPDLKPDA